MTVDPSSFWIFTTLLMALTAATIVGQMLLRRSELGVNPAVVEQFNQRTRAWWMMTAMLALGFLLERPVVTVVLFGFLSFWALREFITLTPTRTADHRTLFWVFVVFTPLQFYFVATDNYSVFTVLVPVYAFLFIPARIALAGDYKRYLERSATIQTGLMICVYCLSHAPAMLYLPIPGGYNTFRLLLFFFIVTALSDGFHYVCEKTMGRHLIAPAISQSKTWEGLLGGLGCTALCGLAFAWATPYNDHLQAAVMAGVVSVMGYGGGLTMSAIKRDRGVKDYGTLLAGHAGVLDRIDSICFAAPVFYHLTRYLVVP